VTILLTGSAGHLGEALMRMLRAQKKAARGLDRKRSAFTDVVGSICDRDRVRAALAGVRAVIHTATLHKPHIATHSRQEFVDTNVSGTLALLEEAAAAGVEAFVCTSTTSTFGEALTPGPGEPAAWITEDVAPVPRNIYGATKLAAEQLCGVVARKTALPVVILRTARFFPEADDDAAIRRSYATENVQALELLFRRADLEDVAMAHLRAVERAPEIRFGTFIVSATTPFTRADLAALRRDAGSLIRARFPESEALFAARGWRFFPSIDRVYVNRLARETLGWQPRYDFRHLLDHLARGLDFRSDLARAVGSKGYHEQAVAEGPYPVEDDRDGPA
jgi:UDP-glucose 4-epimerase